MSTTVACPGCGRPNVNWRVTCLYCGEKMPNPAPPPPPKAVPDNLDALVREAMRGGSVEAIRKALGEARPAEPERPVLRLVPRPAADPPLRAEPSPPPVVPPAPPAGAPEGSLRSALAALSAAAAAAEAAPPETLSAALDQVADALGRARAALPEPAAPPRGVVLPPIRHPYALVVDGIGDPEHAGDLARALEVDLATARTIAAVRYIHVALRGAEAAPLERRVAALHAGTPFRASVLTRAALLETRPAYAVMGRDRDGAWRVVDGAVWETGVDPSQRPPGDRIDPGGPFLAVLGEVEVRIGKSSTETSRWLRQGYSPEAPGAEQRISVLDLHTPTHILRVTPHTTAFDGFPEWDASSTTRSFKRLVDVLPEVFPNLRVEPRRVCAASNATGDARYTSGWPAWEEHSRLARLHVAAIGG